MSGGRYSPDFDRRSPSRSSRAAGGGRTYEPEDRRRSPPPRDRNGRGRSPGGGDEAFSNYYHDRFGSQSPEEYKNLRISHIDPVLLNEELREMLEKEYRRYGDFHVKIIRGTGGPEERLAYINFTRSEYASKARKASTPKMQELLGKYVRVDPAGVIRDQEGRVVAKDQMGGPLMGGGRGYPPPPPSGRGYHSSSRGGYPSYRDPYPRDNRMPYRQPETRRARSPGMGPKRQAGDIRRDLATEHKAGREMDLDEWKLIEHLEQGASRTLFLGNLPFDIREKDLRHIFERYGYVQDVDIKTPRESNAAYAFVCFENLDQAQDAKYHEQDALIGGLRCNIGYGKPTATRRLFVGGLGQWCSLNILETEFDRYGAIDKIEYDRGDGYAYIVFSTLEAATQACRAMMGFPLGGRDRCIRVDYSYDLSAPDPRPERKKAYQAVVDARERDRARGRARSPSSSSRSSSDSRRTPSDEPVRKKKKGPRTPPTTPPPASPPKGRRKSISPDSDDDFVPRIKKEKKEAVSVCNLSAINLQELEKVMDPCWTGAVLLKKSAYAIRLYRLKGDYDMIDEILKDPRTRESHKLHVTQRLPFSQSKPADFERYLSSPEDHVSFLIVAPNPNVPSSELKLAENPTRPLRALVHYLAEKAAAGVITVATQSTAVLYMFPKCPIAEGIMKKMAPGLGVLKANSDDCLLAILVKGSK